MIQTRFRSSIEKSTRRSLRTKVKSTGTCKTCCDSFSHSRREIKGVYASRKVSSKSNAELKCVVRRRGKNSNARIEGKSRICFKNGTRRVISTAELKNHNQETPKFKTDNGMKMEPKDEPTEKQVALKPTFHSSRHPVKSGRRRCEHCRVSMTVDYSQNVQPPGDIPENSLQSKISELNNLIISDTDQLKMRLPSSAEVRTMREKMGRRKVDPKIHPQIYQMTRKTNAFLLGHDHYGNRGQGGCVTGKAEFMLENNRRQAWSLDNRGSVVSKYESYDGHANRSASQILMSKRVDEATTKEESQNLLIPMDAFPVSFYFPVSIINDGNNTAQVFTPTPIMMVNNTRWKVFHA